MGNTQISNEYIEQSDKFSTLPIEHLILIFNMLPTLDILKLSKTCKKFYTIIKPVISDHICNINKYKKTMTYRARYHKIMIIDSNNIQFSYVSPIKNDWSDLLIQIINENNNIYYYCHCFLQKYKMILYEQYNRTRTEIAMSYCIENLKNIEYLHYDDSVIDTICIKSKYFNGKKNKNKIFHIKNITHYALVASHDIIPIIRLLYYIYDFLNTQLQF
jgi:hypothetical protein